MNIKTRGGEGHKTGPNPIVSAAWHTAHQTSKNRHQKIDLQKINILALTKINVKLQFVK
jgi:hypothetical protein